MEGSLIILDNACATLLEQVYEDLGFADACFLFLDANLDELAEAGRVFIPHRHRVTESFHERVRGKHVVADAFSVAGGFDDAVWTMQVF